MPTLRVMTFNVENLLARFQFSKWEEENLAALLEPESEVERANLIRTHWNVIQAETRVFTALCIRQGDPDVVCLQEVENLRALRAFRDRYVRRIGDMQFPYAVLIDGNDPRGIDVAVMSKARIDGVATHQYRERKGMPYYARDGSLQRSKTPITVFRRDCLEVRVIKNKKVLPIYVCHFKSMYGGRPETRPFREAEAATVREILEERFAPDDPREHEWLILGDLNDYTEDCMKGEPDFEHGLGALFQDDFSVDLVKRIPKAEDRWTHFYAGQRHYAQLDYILASPALADRNPKAVPRIIRQGMPWRAEKYQGDRWPRVGYDGPKASDHCPVVVELKYG
jgi:endonuclease/exonuclease/phosphatase family metal-dependent hydrolase